MDLIEAMRTTPTTRYYKPDPVPDELLVRAFDAARFGPQGGNRQPVRWVVVRDDDKKRQLKEWYLEPWKAYLAAATGGEIRIGGMPKIVQDADYFAEHLDEVPVLVVALAEIESLHLTDNDLDRPSIVGGGSVYPTVQNFLLACRNEGLGAALTTLLCHSEPKVKEMLGIPDGFATACHIAVGFPAKPFPKKLSRQPVEEIAYSERFGTPLVGAKVGT